MKLCQITHYLDLFNGVVVDTYFPDALMEMYCKQGVEAVAVYNDNYLPAHLKRQAI